MPRRFTPDWDLARQLRRKKEICAGYVLIDKRRRCFRSFANGDISIRLMVSEAAVRKFLPFL